MQTRPLKGRIALVAGATRGAGRGIARMLGEAGATVYCAGRSGRGVATTGPHRGRPETVEETAEQVTAAGGEGIPVRADLAREPEVEALVARIRREQGGLDTLVNVAGGPEVMDRFKPMWELDVETGKRLFDAWLTPHVVTARHAIPLMIERTRATPGLVVELVEGETLGHGGHYYWDLVITSLKRLAYVLAEELAPKRVAAVAVAPGFMRTEAILDHFGATADNWRQVAESNAEARSFGFAGSETPCFVGRGIASLAADPQVMRWTGGVHSSAALSAEYGFTDVDGARPNWERYFAENFSGMFGKANAPVKWGVVSAT